MSPEIIYEDKDIIVVHKPSGIATQTKGIGSKDMVSILKNHISKETGIKKEPYLAVIHRLDQPVEGLLVFAKTPAAAKDLNKQLTNSGFGKYYRAVLTGTLENTEDDLEDYLVKDKRSNMSKVCTKDTPDTKIARLHYKITDTFEKEDGVIYSNAEITLDTGRHHQIRVQMKNAGVPLAGDRKYGGSCTSYTNLQLIACRLTFIHPATKKKMLFEL